MNMRENRCLGDLESSDKNGGNHTFIVRISDRSTKKTYDEIMNIKICRNDDDNAW